MRLSRTSLLIAFIVALAALWDPSILLTMPVMFGMAAKVEGQQTAEFMISEASWKRSRDAVTVLLGENLKAGHVVGRRLVTPTVAAAAAKGTNTGNGTVTGQAVGTNLGARRGIYTISFIEPATNLGTFQVWWSDPSAGNPRGEYVGDGVVGTEFDNEIKFTVNDGLTDFVAGDAFTIKVTGGTYKYKEYDVADTDGGQRVAGVLYAAVDASAADKAGVVIARAAEVRKDDLQWFTGATTAQKDEAADALAALGIIVRA